MRLATAAAARGGGGGAPWWLVQEAGMTPAKAHPYVVSFGRLGLIEQDGATGKDVFRVSAEYARLAVAAETP